MPVDAKEHYEHVTDAWKYFMGDNLHFGYFETDDMELNQATDRLTDKMLELCDISKDTRILDVGCGIGTPAFYIHKKFKCAIDGISTSERGIELANMAAKEKGYDKKVKFTVADGLDNGFPDKTFDIIWVMESSHLMGDKNKLLKECSRVVKDDGTLVLCDLIMRASFKRQLLHAVQNRQNYKKLARAFGPGNLNRLGFYADSCIKAGFREITVINVTKQASPTLTWWKNNALNFNYGQIEDFSRDDIAAFIAGCSVLHGFFEEGFAGYGIVKAIK
jgi:cyclopropane fatty-acyl-phospholipid synthase-like methyltransferase